MAAVSSNLAPGNLTSDINPLYDGYEMLLDIGEKVHVIERRMFDSDVRRHFIGTVGRVDAAAMRVTGYAFVFDSGMSAYVRSQEQRTRIFPLGAPGFVINVAPAETNIEAVRYVDHNGRLIVTDGGVFNLDINEFGRSR